MAMSSSQTMNSAQLCDDIVRAIAMRSQSEMVHELRPLMPIKLFKAAIKGDSKYIDVLVQLGVQPEEQREVRVTEEASHSAPKETNTENQTIQSELLQSATRFGDTILHLLIAGGHNELALKVFKRDNSLLKAQNNILETPLYCAAKVGNMEIIHYLIQNNRAVMKDALAKTNKTGDTALHVAAKHGHRDIGCVLMNLDSEVAYKVNDKKKTPLYVAIIEGYTVMVQRMLIVDSTLACTPFLDGMFPVHEAARMGNLDLVMHFMQKDPDDAELRDPYGRNFFHIAAEENNEEIFEVVLKDTMSRDLIKRMITAKNYEGNTPFHIAAMEGNRDIMKAIWQHYEANQRVRNRKGYTPLELSAEEVVKNNENINNVMIAEYLETHEHCKFTPKWFDDFMEPPLEDKWERTQVIGLGSVLITTVAFAAAFTMPGGYNEDHGTPVLGRRYMFRAFIVANALAFIQGFLSLFALLIKTLKHVSDNTLVFATMTFVVAASSMVVAFGLGMYVMLAPVCLPIAILLLVITLILGTPPAVILFVELLTYKLGSSMNSNRNEGHIYIWLISHLSFLFIFCLAFV